MSELIDIWRVIELLSDKRCDCNFFVDGQTAYEALSDMIKAVKELPRIDLVRCGECKHQVKQWHEDNRMKSKGFYYYRCDRNKDPFVAHTVNGQPMDFCSYGERRADEHTDKRD